MGPGENAGAIDVGDGLAVVFKVESHNHPSAVEPFQGAATGVGGILRDIFALGARPVAVLDSLRFGDLDTPRTRYLLERVVAGIGAYGNTVGVPTVGGEVVFEAPYEQNCLVNAMCVGLAPADRLIRSAAAGPGNVIVLLGRAHRPRRHRRRERARLRRAGGGRRQAPDRADRRPVRGEQADRVLPGAGRRRPARVAAGPGRRRPVVEHQRDGVEGRRRHRPRRREGAAARAGHGAVRDHDLRVAGADAVRGRARAARRGARGLRALGDARDADRRGHRQRPPARVRGRAARRRHAGHRARRRGSAVRPRAAGARRPARRRSRHRGRGSRRTRIRTRPCARCSARENIASRRWVFEQYDSLVGSRTVRRPQQADAAVLRLALGDVRTDRALAMSIDGNGRRVAHDPVRRGRRGRRRMRGEPRLRRRGAARASPTASTSATPRSRTWHGS